MWSPVGAQATYTSTRHGHILLRRPLRAMRVQDLVTGGGDYNLSIVNPKS